MSLRSAWRVFPCALFAALAVQWIALQPYEPARLWIPAAILALPLAGAALFGERLAPSIPARLRRALPRVCASALLFLALAELSLRALALASPSPLLKREDLSARALIDQFRPAPGSLFGGFPRNRGGHFDEEFAPKRDGRTLVVAIGDSFSQGMVPHGLHFTTVAEKLLDRCDVANMGVAGLGPREYLYLLEREALPLRPDLVVIDFFVGNDVEEAGRIVEHGVLASWLDRRALSLWLVLERLVKLRTAPLAANPLDSASRAPGGGDGAGDSRSLSERATAESLAKYSFLRDPMQEPPSFDPDTFLWTERKRAREICTQNGAPFGPLWDALNRILETADPTLVAVMLIPDELQVEDAVWNDVVAGLPGEDLDRDRAQRVIKTWCLLKNVPCLDLLPALRAAAPLADGRRHVYHLRDTHLNARGNEIAGKELARFIAELLPAAASRPR